MPTAAQDVDYQTGDFTGYRVLVTGASGVLGSGVAQALRNAGAQVTVLQRSASGLDGVHEIRGSVTDAEAVTRAVADVDSVIHIAAKVSVSGPLEAYEEVNVEGTRTLLTAAQQAGVSRWIHISSPSVAHSGDSIIGQGAGPADPDAARGHYAATKAAGERLALAADSNDFRVLVLRPHLMWGPGDTQLTERIIDRARKNRLPLLDGGTALVDTLFLVNAVEAIVAGLVAVDHTHGEALVLTNGQPRPIGEMIRRIAVAGGASEPSLSLPAGLAKTAGSVIETFWDAEKRGDEPPLTRFLAEQMSTAHWFDQRRTQEVLGWQPRISLAEGFRLTAQYYRR
ncbi:NAD-dependent epimerase/dehydratase family protein [Enteractinococcus coprophilus]|uniref:Nucleoside-diphosphate-sugar epimerase n=1 Tax=Enteractinococcus coprophilus TaxID=1027633 RepID=A0A543AJN4_9MICC|nr:NAD-dependent epimerase/dehydratase family protein [Enteractinococcus coprophilus]TQL72803.1 nucleoside-diphosphate-sugar epimerase [Enteractinococcus coprophilus]